MQRQQDVSKFSTLLLNDAKEEDEDETKIHNDWSTSRMNKKKRLGNKQSSDEVDNSKNKYEALESDSDDYEEDENKDGGEFFS